MLTSVHAPLQDNRQTRHPPLHRRQGTFRSMNMLTITNPLENAEELEIDLPTQSSHLLVNTTDIYRTT